MKNNNEILTNRFTIWHEKCFQTDVPRINLSDKNNLCNKLGLQVSTQPTKEEDLWNKDWSIFAETNFVSLWTVMYSWRNISHFSLQTIARKRINPHHAAGGKDH